MLLDGRATIGGGIPLEEVRDEVTRQARAEGVVLQFPGDLPSTG